MITQTKIVVFRMHELILTFRHPKSMQVGNFTVEDGLNACRDPLLFRDHTTDIITWKDENDVYRHKNLRIRPPKTAQSKKCYPHLKCTENILTWNDISNDEYNQQNMSHERIMYAPYTASYRSQLQFNGDLLPFESSDEFSNLKRKQMPHNKSSYNVISWDTEAAKPHNPKNHSSANKHVRLTWEKYRHDDRVPYQN